MFKQIEEMSFNAWPSIKTNFYKGCIIRSSAGYTKRANSINPLYYNNEDVSDIIIKCNLFLENQNIPVVYKIIDNETYKNLDNRLEDMEYKKLDYTHVMIVNLEETKLTNSITIVKIDEYFNDEWIQAFIDINNVGQNSNTASQMLKSINCKTYVASISEKGKIIACGYGAIENNHIGFFDIIVDRNSRGKGYGREIMQGIIREALTENIKYGYLQVIASNDIAINLYNNLGFKISYNYWYRKKP